MSCRLSLLGITAELDTAIEDLAFYATRYQAFHPAASGDVSSILSNECQKEVVETFSETASDWFSFSNIENLSRIRKDGRQGYRSENIVDPDFYEALQVLGGRIMIITRTGSQLPEISRTLKRGIDGKLLCLIEFNSAGDSIRILYGNHEFGSLPSIELHIHALASSISLKDGCDNPATVHAHPYNLIRLGMEPVVAGDEQVFNLALYSQIEGINRIDQKLVAVLPYVPSGSAILVRMSHTPLKQHNMLLWMNHGFTVRSASIERGYAVMAYAEQCAIAAIDAIRHGSTPLPHEYLHDLPALFSHEQ